ncbi:GumC family protein [Methylomonas sp. YC3]
MMFPYRHDFQIVGDDFYRSHPTPWPRRLRRRTLFLLVLLPLLLITETYVFLQPAVFESQALVLTTAATDIDQTHAEADLEHVNIQKQVLLGQPVLEKTAETLKQQDGIEHPNINQLKELFQVKPVADTNLVQLAAEGSHPQFLQMALNTWIKTYQQIRADYIAEITDKASTSIKSELTRLEQQVRDKRQDIESFRLQHDILSLESTDNEAHARLQGLNNSLNAALEEEAKAKAKLDAIHAAVAEGKAVVPEADSQSLAALTQQAERLRERLEAQRSQYTDEYIEFHPSLRNLKTQLAELDEKIASKEQAGSSYATQEAENAYGAAHRTVLTIQKQMAEHKQKAAEYTNQFAKHKAMQEELLKLEELLQQTKQRLVEIDVKQRQSNPQLDVVDWASLPDKPVKPDYGRDAGIAGAASLAIALLVVWLNDYLNKEPTLTTINSVTEFQIYQQSEPKLENNADNLTVGTERRNRLRRADDLKQLPDETTDS